MSIRTEPRRMAAPVLLFAALAAAVLLPLRLWQQLTLVESDTGFWKSGGATVAALYIVLALLFAVPAGYAFFARKTAALDTGWRARAPEGVFALLSAAAFVVDAVMALWFFVSLVRGYGRQEILEGFETQSGSAVQYFVRTGAVAALFETLFGVASAGFFLTLAACDILPRRRVALSRLLAIMPTFWVICRLLRRFARMISYLRVSDLLLNILMLSALLVFFLAFAECLSGINAAGKASRLIGAGAPAAVLMLVCFVPRFAAYTLRRMPAPPDAAVEWCDPALALFIAAFVAGRLVKAVPAQAEEPQEEALREEEPQGGAA